MNAREFAAKWGASINVEKLPELVHDIFGCFLEFTPTDPTVEVEVKATLGADGQWYDDNGNIVPLVPRVAQKMYEDQQAPGVKASLSPAEQARLSQMAGKPIESYQQLEAQGITLDIATRKPAAPKPSVVPTVMEKLQRAIIPEGLMEMASKNQMSVVYHPDGKIEFVPTNTIAKRDEEVDVPTVPEDFEEGDGLDENDRIVDFDDVVEVAKKDAHERHGQRKGKKG